MKQHAMGRADRSVAIILGAIMIVARPSAAQFDAAFSEATVTAATVVDEGAGPMEMTAGGTFSPALPALSQSPSSDQTVMFGTASAASSIITDLMNARRFSASGFAGSDTDGFGEKGGTASSSAGSSFTVRFTISEPHRWTFHYGSVNGTHAGGSVSLYLIGAPGARSAPTFFFDSISTPFFDGETGEIGPGTYQFNAEVSAFTFSGDGFGGLFADASFDLDFEIAPLAPPPCPGDASGDGAVTFADITSVLTFWLIDYTPGTGAGDANHDGVVNFSDITEVLTFFGVACP
jgi:hypothetical protein